MVPSDTKGRREKDGPYPEWRLHVSWCVVQVGTIQ